MTYVSPLCANGLCSKPVRPARGQGRPPKYCSMRCRTRANTRAYYYRMKALEAPVEEEIDMAIRVCKNDGCGKTVPLTKGTTPRVYCSIRCRAQFNAREHYNRSIGKGANMLRTDANGELYVIRHRAKNAKGAETAFKNHLVNCESGDDVGKCPARFDPYDTKKQCLIHAVLREDWDEQRRKEVHGVTWERVATTDTGYWKLPQGI